MAKKKKVRLKPIGRGSCWLRRRWPQTQPSPGVWWRRRRRRRRAAPRSCSTLWGGKAARNLPDRLLHSPPSSLLPPPRSSSLFPPSSPKPAASTDLSNGWQRSRREMKRGEQGKGSGEGKSSPARPRQPAARSAGRGGEKGEPGGERRAAPPRPGGAIPAPGSRPWQPRPRRPHPPGPRATQAPNCGGSRPASGLFLGAQGLITVRHSWESACGSGWGVKKATRSWFAY